MDWAVGGLCFRLRRADVSTGIHLRLLALGSDAVQTIQFVGGGGKFGGGKGYSPNLKLEAMKLSVDLVLGEAIKIDQLSAYADKIHNYIKS